MLREKMKPSWAQIMPRIMVFYPDHGSGYKKKDLPSHKTALTNYLSILDGDPVCILLPGATFFTMATTKLNLKFLMR